MNLLHGDCLALLPHVPDESVSLVVTSPPYADSRKSTYGGVAPDDYAQWFVPVAHELKRVLRPDGTFVLNIKEKAVSGERHTYVLELILALKKEGWLWTEEYIWHKRNCAPGKWPNRFRDAWERCLQFNKQKNFAMYQEAVMVPTGDWAKSRLQKLSDTDKTRDTSKVGSGFGKNISNWVGRDLAYPTNVLHLATECGNKNHSAAFPKELPSWFIRLFTQKGDLVLDPFAGSGTTGQAALELGRDFLGMELKDEYYHLALENLAAAQEKARAQQLKNFMINLPPANSPYQAYQDYLSEHVIAPFYAIRLNGLQQLQLTNVLKRKNPCLFKAKNIELAGDFVKSIVDAFLSSQEETIFGNLLEGFAIYIAAALHGGFKSSLKSVDLEFSRDDKYYIVGIKSGTSWGNADQVSKMKDNFKASKELLRTQGVTQEVVAVNGCMYGRDRNPLKTNAADPDKTYYKYAGQDFWAFLSGDDNLYQEIVAPIEQQAQQKDADFKKAYAAKINEMTLELVRDFTIGGQLDWPKLIAYVSGRDANTTALF